jgi:predicted ArsR family transcriptional regulator
VLDSFDRAILDLLQRDNTLPQREIAEVVHLSTPAVQRRIKRLQDSGVIAANGRGRRGEGRAAADHHRRGARGQRAA